MAKTASASRAKKAYNQTSSKKAGFSSRKRKMVGSSKALKTKSCAPSGTPDDRKSPPVSLPQTLPAQVLAQLPKSLKPRKPLNPAARRGSVSKPTARRRLKAKKPRKKGAKGSA
jgi:hypothetical protein